RTQIQVRHEREQRAAVVGDPFPNSTRQFIVCPVAGACLRIRGDVRRVHLSGEALQQVHVLARAQCSGQDRCLWVRPVMLCMATHAVGYMVHQIIAARQPRWRAVELPCRQLPRPRPDERSPADGGRNGCDRNRCQNGQHPCSHLPTLFHLCPRNPGPTPSLLNGIPILTSCMAPYTLDALPCEANRSLHWRLHAPQALAPPANTAFFNEDSALTGVHTCLESCNRFPTRSR